MTSSTIDHAWAALADLPQDERRSAVRDRSHDLAGADRERQVETFVGMLQAEAELPEAQHEALTATRLRCWLDLPPEEVSAMAASLAEARRRLPGRVAMRNVTGVQTAIRTLERQEIEALVVADESFREALPPELRRSVGAEPESPPEAVVASGAPPERSLLRRLWDGIRRRGA